MSDHFRPYTGNVDTAASLLASARRNLHGELCDVERRVWTEDQAGELIKQHMPVIRQNLADMQRMCREIEVIVTAAEEEQDAAKKDISDAA